jgi:hypothetical protein
MSELITGIASEINREHEQVQECFKSGFNHALRVGELLCEVKSELPHGEFTKWIEANCNFGVRMAQRYMEIYSNKDYLLKAKRVAHLTDGEFTIRKALDVIESKKSLERIKQNEIPVTLEGKVRFRIKDQNREVKSYLDSVIGLIKGLPRAKDALDYGLFSDEAKRFTIRKNELLIKQLQEFNDALKGGDDDVSH